MPRHTGTCVAWWPGSHRSARHYLPIKSTSKHLPVKPLRTWPSLLPCPLCPQNVNCASQELGISIIAEGTATETAYSSNSVHAYWCGQISSFTCAGGTLFWPVACRNAASAPGPTPTHSSTARHTGSATMPSSTASWDASPSGCPAWWIDRAHTRCMHPRELLLGCGLRASEMVIDAGPRCCCTPG